MKKPVKCNKRDCVVAKSRVKHLHETIEYRDQEVAFANRELNQLREALDTLLKLSPFLNELQERVRELERNKVDREDY